MAARSSDQLIMVKFPVTASLIAALGVLGLSAAYWFATDKFAETILFFSAATAAAGAILTAFYTARALASSITALEKEDIRRRRALAFEYTARWNDPSMYHVRDTVRELFAADHKSREYDAKIEERETNVIHFLNFLEELALVVDNGDADPDILKDQYCGVVTVAWTKLQHWITAFRRNRGRARIWIGVEALARKWN